MFWGERSFSSRISELRLHQSGRASFIIYVPACGCLFAPTCFCKLSALGQIAEKN